MARNEDVYEDPEVAALYARQYELLPAEVTLLQLMRPDLRTARMLDLGVGGGRTTLHFAGCVREYVGVDYSQNMIRECKKRFAESSEPVSFVVGDARELPMFAEGSFDFILFSMNGIDSVNHADRLRILKEIRRVGKPGGWFCFSSHNLNFGAQLFELRQWITLNPKFAKRTARRLKWRFVSNWRVRAAAIRRSQSAMINEPNQSRRVPMYYIRPEEQLLQLREDFGDVRVFSFTSGSEITGHGELRNAQDMCLYYLCRIGN